MSREDLYSQRRNDEQAEIAARPLARDPYAKCETEVGCKHHTDRAILVTDLLSGHGPHPTPIEDRLAQVLAGEPTPSET
jgi:hypothetical protein